MTSYEKIHKTFKSRKNILDILRRVGYDTHDYEGFDENEISIMIETDQLDMILYKKPQTDAEIDESILGGGRRRKSENMEKVLVKYNINMSKINADQSFLPNINDYFEPTDESEKGDGFYLNKNDLLIMVVDTEITDNIKERLRTIYENYGHFVVMHNIARLQYNILEHVKNPKSFHILTNDEVEKLKRRIFIRDTWQLPEISRFDPYALAICLRPGQIVQVTRTSVNSLDYDSWHYCL